MKKQTGIFIYVVAAIILLAGAFQYFSKRDVSLQLPSLNSRDVAKPEETITSPKENTKTEEVVIDFGNGQKIEGQVSTQSAYQALIKVAKDNKLTVEAKNYKYGVMVVKVGDKTGTDKMGWMYSVNGKPGQIASDRYVINPGDQVLWEYKKF